MTYTVTPITNTFVNGNVADADDVNQDFADTDTNHDNIKIELDAHAGRLDSLVLAAGYWTAPNPAEDLDSVNVAANTFADGEGFEIFIYVFGPGGASATSVVTLSGTGITTCTLYNGSSLNRVGNFLVTNTTTGATDTLDYAAVIGIDAGAVWDTRIDTQKVDWIKGAFTLTLSGSVSLAGGRIGWFVRKVKA